MDPHLPGDELGLDPDHRRRLVFNGGTNDRMFRAFDARTGEQLWSFKTNSGIMAPPSSYEVDGTQYIAVQSGCVDPAFQQGLINDLLGTDLVVPQGGVIWVFALGSNGALLRVGRRAPVGPGAAKWAARSLGQSPTAAGPVF